MKLKQYLPAVIVILALASVAALWWGFNPPRAKVVSVVPAPAAEGVELDVIGRIVFDREIKADWVELAVSPEVVFTTTLPFERRSLVFTFQEELEPEAVYTVQVSGKRVAPFSWSFKTKSAEPGIESGGQGDPDFWKYEKQAYEEDPLLFIAPHLTFDWKVTRLEKGKAKVDLYAEDKETARQEVLEWLREKGVDPKTLDIQWVE